jgi:hypothetical protein
MASIATAQRNRAADAVLARAANGSLVIYGGTPPADANAALSSNPVLATLTLSATPFPAAANGASTATTGITADSSADNTGTATFFRVLESGGTVVVFQGTVGTSGAELNLSSTSIVAGGNVSVSSLTYTQAGS